MVQSQSEADPINLAFLTLAGAGTITGLADQHHVSRKFVYEQANKASTALAEGFASSAPDDEVLFELPVTKTWLRQLTLGFTLIGHGSYRGVVELMRDLLGVRISEGTTHNVHQATPRQAGPLYAALAYDRDINYYGASRNVPSALLCVCCAALPCLTDAALFTQETFQRFQLP